MTAELAMLMPVVVVMLCAVAAAGAVVVAQLRCVDAARSGARSAARGDPPGAALGTARRAAPAGARVVLSAAGGLVTVSVDATVRLPLPGRPQIGVRSRGVAVAEQPGVG